MIKLHFPSMRTAYRRLQALTTLGYLKAFTVPHIPERVFYIDKPGAEVVAGELNITVDNLKWHRTAKAPKDYYFLRHFLAINDFRIQITLSCQDSPLSLLGFIPEYYGEKTAQGNVKKYIRDRVCDISNHTIEYSHTPDAVFALEKENKPALFFFEVDRGTEIISDPEKGLLKSLIFYLHYWADKKYHRYSADFGGRAFTTFRTLIVTTSRERLYNIRSVVGKLSFTPEQAKRFLWITTQDAKNILFEPVWQSLDSADDKLYKIGG
jgi:hypothetical protein